MYKHTHGRTVLRLADNASIPDDEQNRDYQEYLAWMAQGNTTLSADPLPNPRLAVITKRLAAIDMESIRALRTKSLGKDGQQDRDKLSTLENEAAALRSELARL